MNFPMSGRPKGLVLYIRLAACCAAIAFVTSRKRRSQKLRERFGPEYDRVLQQEGDARKAEGVLEFRQKHREKFKIRPLSDTDRASFDVRWKEERHEGGGRDSMVKFRVPNSEFRILIS